MRIVSVFTVAKKGILESVKWEGSGEGVYGVEFNQIKY